MTLLADLKALDTSAIAAARVDIKVSVDGEGIGKLLGGSLSVAALGPLGDAIAALDKPEALVAPLLAALRELEKRMNLSDLPVGKLAEAVAEAGEVVSALLDGIDERPESWLKLIGLGDGAVTGALGGAVGLAKRFEADIGPLRDVLDMLDGKLPRDPAVLGRLIVEYVLPFPGDALHQLRALADGVAGELDALVVPATRFSGLVIELEAVAAAAEAGKLAEVDARIAAASQAAAIGLASLGEDLRRLRNRVEAVDLARKFAPLASLAGAFRTGRYELLDMLDELRGYMKAGREAVEAIGPEAFDKALGLAENYVEGFVADARARMEAAIDAKVAALSAWLRGLFAHLGLRAIRADISAGVSRVGGDVRTLDPHVLMFSLREPLQGLRDLLTTADLSERVRGALDEARAAMDAALTPITTALDTIAAAVTALAAQAGTVLGEATAVVEGFASTVEDAKATIEALDVSEARERVVATVAELREAAAKLLGTMPLPEPLRPAVEQLIAEVEKLDRHTLEEQILGPVRDAVAQIKLPPAVAKEVTAALGELARLVEELLPQSLIEGIEGDVAAVLARLRGFDPATLGKAVTGFVGETAGRIEKLDLGAPLDVAGAQVDRLLALVDRIRPSTLLAPAIEAHRRAVKALPLPDPEAAQESAFGFLQKSADTMGGALVAPAAKLAGAKPGATPPSDATTPAPPFDPASVVPAEALRLFTHLPDQLHAAIVALEAGPAGQLAATVAGLTGGLARDLRALEDRIGAAAARLDDGLAAALRAVQAAELRARFAVAADLSLGPVALKGRLDLLAAADPTRLREQLAGEMRAVRASLDRLVGTDVAGLVEGFAGAIEACRLARPGEGGLAALFDTAPLVAEFDALVKAVLVKVIPLGFAARERVEALIHRVEAAFRDLDPMTLGQRFLRVVEVVREELDLLDPASLAAELDGVHAAVRADIAALDPRVLKSELTALTGEIAGQLRALDPAALLGDLDPFAAVVARVEAADPAKALAGVGGELDELGERMRALDPAALIDAVNALPERVVDEFAEAAGAIIDEVLALLESLRFATGSVGVSASVSVG